jgi:hypothetical protein
MLLLVKTLWPHPPIGVSSPSDRKASVGSAPSGFAPWGFDGRAGR